MTSGLLEDALGALDGTGSALGPTLDGGWWAIGLRRPDPAVFLGVPMSTTGTCAVQHRRLRSLNLDVTLLPTVVDLDTVHDIPAVAEAAPPYPTAALARQLGLVPELELV